MVSEVALQKEQEPLRCSDPHPIAGRCGVGSPFCPPGWRWRTGNRVQDMYFTAPSGERFRSKNELKAYLDKASNPPKMSEFLWRVPPECKLCPINDEYKGYNCVFAFLCCMFIAPNLSAVFKDGQLPGENVPSPLRPPTSSKGSGQGGSRRRKRKRKAAEVRERNGKTAADVDNTSLLKLKDVARKTLMVEPPPPPPLLSFYKNPLLLKI